MAESDEMVQTYSNGALTVVWKPQRCIHAQRCFRGLPEVFDPKARPWIDPKGADKKAIMAQIDQCPSGALSYRLPDAEASGAHGPSNVEG